MILLCFAEQKFYNAGRKSWEVTTVANTKMGPTTAQGETETLPRVAFDLTPAMEDELQRILSLTDLASRPEVFRRAFTLLRIHVDAARDGRRIYMDDPNNPNDRYIITLPFNVTSEPRNTE